MAVYLPLMMQNLFNTPVALQERKAVAISAALSGRLNIQSLETETLRLDARALQDLAAAGRRSAPNPGAQIIDTYGERPYEITESGIAIIRIQGTLTRTWGVGPLSGATGYDGIWTQLLAAQDDRMVRAIWMDINSPGGAIDGLFDLTEGIQAMNGKAGGKPIYAMAADYAYSAAFAIGAACDKLFVPPLGGVGSVGVITMHADITKALDEEGISVKIFRSGARKAIGTGGLEPLDQEEEDHIQRQIDIAGNFFVERAAEFLGLAKSKVAQTQGRDYIGLDAKAIGFVDDILPEQHAWAKLERLIAR